MINVPPGHIVKNPSAFGSEQASGALSGPLARIPTGNVSRAVAVSIVGAAGGVGVTTIAATLARQLTKDGGRCGLYDTAPDSLLPVYFGNQQIATNQHRFAGLHSVLQPSIRFLSPDACANLESIVSAEALSPLEKLARHFAHEFEHVMFLTRRAKICAKPKA